MAYGYFKFDADHVKKGVIHSQWESTLRSLETQANDSDQNPLIQHCIEEIREILKRWFHTEQSPSLEFTLKHIPKSCFGSLSTRTCVIPPSPSSTVITKSINTGRHFRIIMSGFPSMKQSLKHVGDWI
ncbi:unnamed protein product [Lepeophtheirus salmonis]|uniref:(salmon louse) hypothetical protein n=1 Tax=Lepeophtheirus salmonis TaxID=72036 RepID=A0A7R8H1B1_LEPSM|nr:unnamed protein product [Lepeophtheirus salmonis]CAF2804143.1 unnamed protein product [Lepeophtheirus salmonis]